MALLAGLMTLGWIEGASGFSVGRLGRYGYEVKAKVWGVEKERVLEFLRKPPEEMRRPLRPEEGRGEGEATWWLCFSADWADLRLGTAYFRAHRNGWDTGPLYLLRLSWVPKGFKARAKEWRLNWTTLDLTVELEGPQGKGRTIDVVALGSLSWLALAGSRGGVDSKAVGLSRLGKGKAHKGAYHRP